MNKNWQMLANVLSHDKGLDEETIWESLKEAIINYYAKEKDIEDKENISVNLDDEAIKISYKETTEILESSRRMLKAIEQNFHAIINKNEKDDFLYSLYNERCQYYTGKVRAIKKDGVMIDYKNHDLYLDRSEMLDNEFYKPGQNISFTVIEKEDDLVLSRKDPKAVVEWLKKTVIEVEEGLVKIMKAGRLPGKISAVVVDTKPGLDPIKTIIRRTKMEFWGAMNKGEKIKLLRDQNLTDTIINAYPNIEVEKIMIDEDEQLVEIIVNNQSEQLEQLKDVIDLIFNYNLQSYTQEQWDRKEESSYKYWLKETAAIGISEEIAEILFNNNISNFDDLAKNTESIEEIDDEELLILQNIAKNHLNHGWQDDFNNQEIDSLNRAGIKTLQGLADLAYDELQEIVPMNEERAKKIIVTSRQKTMR